MDSTIAKCPHCTVELDPPEAAICINCGFYIGVRARQSAKLSLGGEGTDNDTNQPNTPDSPETWAVWRIDDNGNTFIVRDHLDRAEADRLIAEFTARGHKQMYWAEREAGQAEPDPAT